jgi:3-dehydroquinate synthase
MEAGEEHKTLQTCENLWNQLSERGADRNSALINLGGGVVTDLGGFVACTFKRGIDFYNLPTTLLAMVDASVGGKTGIDLGALKNQIGIIEEPKQVLIDAQWLQTLPQEELRSGFAEMLKHGLISNERLLGTTQKLTKVGSHYPSRVY